MTLGRDHTPLPWFLGEKIKVDGHETQSIESAPRPEGGLFIANVFMERDAEFIVRAVNSYEELLKAVRGAVMMLRSISRDAVGPLKESTSWKAEILEEIITKAEGGTL